MPTLRESIALSIAALKQQRSALDTAHKAEVAALESRVDVLISLHSLLNVKFDPEQFDAAYAAAVKLGIIPDIAMPADPR